LIADSFYTPFIAFINLLAIPTTAWVGVFLVDMMRRQRYDAAGLMDLSRSSSYWYRGGVEPRALGAWAVAIVVGYQFIVAGPQGEGWCGGGWAASWLGRNGLGWVVAFVVAGGLYTALGGARGGRPTKEDVR